MSRRVGPCVLEERDALGPADAVAAGMLPGERLGAWTVALEAGAHVDTVLASLPPMRARDAITLYRAAPAITSTSGAKP